MNLTRSLGSHDAPTSIVTRCVHVTVVYLALLLAACGSGTVGSTAATAPPSGGDNIGPAITISAPTSAANYTSSSATLGSLAGTASDAVGVTQVSWVNSLGGSGTASGTTNWSISNIPLVSSATPNLITVTARDAAGNIGTDTVSVSYSAAGGSDTTAPVITITAPSLNPSYTSSSATLTLAGTASDAVGVTQVSWVNSLGGSGTASGTTNWSISNIPLVSSATPNLITVTARDAAGNIGTDTISVSYGAGGGSSNTFYISPTGLDSNNGTTVLTPWKTFAHAFSIANMQAGDELILLDGTYSVAAGIDTGIINNLGAGSGQPPSGTGVNNVTRVRALNAGSVTIAGGLFIGSSFRKDSYITIQGITFDGNSGGSENGGALYNTSYVTIKDCGFRGGLGVGTNDHTMGNTYALIEDVWIWGINTRISLIIYRSDHVVVRRAVVRNDGCLAGAPCSTNSGNAMVGTTIYNSHDVSFQNVIAVDNVRGAGFGGASDFSIAWHQNSFYPFHRNEWLGTMSVNTGLEKSYYYDIDNIATTVQPMATYQDIVAINTQSGVPASGLSLNMNCGGPTCPANNISVRNATLRTVNDSIDPSFGIYVNPSLAVGIIDLQNIIVFGGGSTGVSSPDRPSYVDVYVDAASGFTSAYSQLPCTTGCYTSNPTADGATPSLRYPTRIESGSLLKGSGAGGADIGATVLNRYGTDGTRHGDPGYNTLTSTPLWPWPNEARIRQQMCAGVTRGFCSAGTRLDLVNPVTLTSYIWEQLGNPIPSGIYP